MNYSFSTKSLFLLLSLSLLNLCSPVAHKRLHKVPKKHRNGNDFIVHISTKVPWAEAEQLILELETLNENSSLPNFKAEVIAKIVQLVYGFAAKLSPEALEYVS